MVDILITNRHYKLNGSDNTANTESSPSLWLHVRVHLYFLGAMFKLNSSPIIRYSIAFD